MKYNLHRSRLLRHPLGEPFLPRNLDFSGSLDEDKRGGYRISLREPRISFGCTIFGQAPFSLPLFNPGQHALDFLGSLSMFSCFKLYLRYGSRNPHLAFRTSSPPFR
jgi:hypothetical protein